MTDAGPAVYLGRRTRNLLDAAFAPFVGVPDEWQGLIGVNFPGGGRLAVDASAGPVSLSLPPMTVEPAAELLDEGTSYVGVPYQLSVSLGGQGAVTLALRDTAHGLSAETTVKAAGDGLRPCVALDGPLEPRTLEGGITVHDGHATLGGLMVEPFITTHRTCDNAARFPCPGSWVPGGQIRERDRLEARVPAGAIPTSGMIDLWFKPAWNPLHPNHVFFEMSHWYFSFEMDPQSPLFHAGEKPCPWTYYWEWCLAQDCRANTWHHYAAVWNAEDGTVTLYFDGQARACIRQAGAHALDPHRIGETLVIGGPVGKGMLADPNVSGELEGHLRTWRLTPGRISAEDVLVAMEASDPRPRQTEPPPRAICLQDGPRALAASDEAHCWFPQWVQRSGEDLVVPFAASDDNHPGKHLRPRPGKRLARSRDGGYTWTVDREKSLYISIASLPDGRECWLTQQHDQEGHPFSLRLVDRSGREETFQAIVENGKAPYALTCLLPLRDGRCLFFGYGNGMLSVLASEDLRHWRVLSEVHADGKLVTNLSETAAVQFPSGRIMTVSRTNGWNEALVKCFSDDGGATWTAPAPTGICGVFPTMQTLSDGTLFLSVGRPGIVLAVSHDCGQTFDTRVCAEDDRIHEYVAHFGWYGYSTMNNGLLVDEAARKAFVSYDMLGVRLPDNAASLNACYVRHYAFRVLADYPKRVKAFLPADAAAIRRVGRWQVVPDRLAVSTETGAALTGEFTGSGLVALLETSPYAGTALVSIDEGPEARMPLYYPQRLAQRRLLAADLPVGQHRFRISLETGRDPAH
ncbi:MAG: sialidase family protein, partial [Planctomycetota bacterium]